MGGQVIADGVWVGSEFISKGTRRDAIAPDLAGRVGSHLWVEEAERANVDPTTGAALTGLKDGVWIDGVFYAKGTVPPHDVIPKVGAHMWVQGFAPVPDEEPLAFKPLTLDVPPAPDPEVNPLVVEAADVPLAGLLDQGAPESAEFEESSDPAADGDEPAARDEDRDAPAPPPHAGKGSSEDHWRAYAEQVGVNVEGIETRKGIIAAVEAARKPV